MKTDDEYRQWLSELKLRFRQSQIKAAVKVNSELIAFYWNLGHDIVEKQATSKWGDGLISQLSKDLKAEFPDVGGFSQANISYTKQFYLFYNQLDTILHQVGGKLETKNDTILHQVGGQLKPSEIQAKSLCNNGIVHLLVQVPWRHHIEIIAKCKKMKKHCSTSIRQSKMVGAALCWFILWN